MGSYFGHNFLGDQRLCLYFSGVGDQLLLPLPTPLEDLHASGSAADVIG